MEALLPILIILLIIILCSIRQINEYQRGVLYTFGNDLHSSELILIIEELELIM